MRGEGISILTEQACIGPKPGKLHPGNSHSKHVSTQLAIGGCGARTVAGMQITLGH